MTTQPETVTVYTKPDCVQCNATFRAFDKQGITYEVRDVTQDQDAYDHITGMGYQQAPVVEAGAQHWSGYRPDRIKQLRE